MSFGLYIRQRRIEMGYGLNEFSGRIGISPAYWSRVERGIEHAARGYIRGEHLTAPLAHRLEPASDEAGNHHCRDHDHRTHLAHELCRIGPRLGRRGE